MDYEAMTAGELQKECARRGLPSSRAAKAVMVQRLHDHDAEQSDSAGAEPASLAPTGQDDTPEASTDVPTAATPASAYRMDFPAEPGGPDEETHLAYRQATIQAAAEAGLSPRGDARLAATSGGVWVYEVSVRQVT